MQIDAKGIYYRELNEKIHQLVNNGEKKIEIINLNGQRYIGTGLKEKDVEIILHGTAGEDLGVFMDGPTIKVYGNAQNGAANTMNDGKIVIYGMAGDVLGYGMRAGKLYVRDSVGYRVGIHMKGFLNKIPAIVVGGKAGNFFGEYMAGGRLILLGYTNEKGPIVGDYVGTGMHGGVMYIRGEINKRFLGKEVGIVSMTEEDKNIIKTYVEDFANDFDLDANDILSKPFTKIIPVSKRPYGAHYVY